MAPPTPHLIQRGPLGTLFGSFAFKPLCELNVVLRADTTRQKGNGGSAFGYKLAGTYLHTPSCQQFFNTTFTAINSRGGNRDAVNDSTRTQGVGAGTGANAVGSALDLGIPAKARDPAHRGLRSAEFACHARPELHRRCALHPRQETIQIRHCPFGVAAECHAIVDAGLILQIDSPDLGLGRHMMFKELDETAYLARIEKHLEALNFALVALPADRVRMHVCWGNYEGPHHQDVPLATILPTVLKAKPQGLLFETANPRHGHEWATIRDMRRQIPDDKILIPGVLDTTTNFIEHSQLIAQRLQRFVDIVGAERVIAGSDCGFGTFAGFGVVDEDIVYAKLAAMAQGAASIGL